jgi:quercetin dioxygenase-like cupin family protein
VKFFRREAAFTDARGSITDILDGVPLNAVTIITNKKGAVRANHFHKKTIQYTYVLTGRVRYVSRGKKGGTTTVIMKPGDLAVSPPHEAHATEALTDATFLALAHGLRHGRDYEKDTFRLAEPLIAPKKKASRK